MTQFRIAQKILLFNSQNQVLVLKASTTRAETADYFRGKCDFPGGGLHIDESLEQGLKREITEELGPNIQYTVKNPTLIWDWYHQTLKGEKKRSVCILYEAQYSKGDITISSEHDSYHWVSIPDLARPEYQWHHSEKNAIVQIQNHYKPQMTSQKK